MKIYHLRFTVILLPFFIVLMSGQPLHATISQQIYTTLDGLPSPFIKHVNQTNDGHIVVATDDGLSFFDGYSFVTRTMAHGLPDNLVKQTVIDHNGRLLVATDRGLAIANPQEDTAPPQLFHPVSFHPPDDDYRVRALFLTRSNEVILAGSNLIYLLDEHDRIQPVPFAFEPRHQSDLVRSFKFSEDEEGGILITSVENGLLYLPSTRDTIYQLPGTELPDQLREIKALKTNTWLIGSEQGLWQINWDPERRQVNKTTFLEETRHIVVDAILHTRKERFLIGSNGMGLFALEMDTRTLEYRHDYYSGYIKHIFADKHKNQWISTDHGLVFKPNMPFGNIDPDQGLPRRYITGALSDSRGNLWVSTHEGFFIRPKHQLFFHKSETLDINFILHIETSADLGTIYAYTAREIYEVDTYRQSYRLIARFGTSGDFRNGRVAEDGVFWIADNTGRLRSYDPETQKNRFWDQEDGVGEEISGITLLRNRIGKKELWISGRNRYLARYDPASDRFQPYSWDEHESAPSENAYLSNLQAGNRQELLISGSDGIHLLTIKEPERTEGTEQTEKSEQIRDTVQTGDTSLTKDTNLSKDTGQTEVTQHTEGTEQSEVTNQKEQRDQLRHVSDVQGVQWLILDEDRIWAGTNRYLMHFREEQDGGYSWRRFDTSSGLVSTSFSQGAAHLDDDGYLWMGTNVGLVYYNGGYFPKSSSPVRLISWSAETRVFSSTQEQQLDFGTNSFVFHVSTFDYPAHDVIYQTRLAGTDQEWSEPTHNNIFNRFFSGTGRFTIEIRASRNSSEWSEPLRLSFTINPPWWRTRIMLGAYVLLTVISVLGFINWRSARLKRQNKLLSDEVQKRTRHLTETVDKLEKEIRKREIVENELRESNFTRERLIKILSHDLRSPFQGIMGFSSLLQDSYDEFSDQERLDMVNRIIKSTDGAMELLNRMLDWTQLQSGSIPFNPREINLSTLSEQVADRLSGMAESKKITVERSVPDHVTLTADANMLESILQNLLSNALKYTKPGGRVTLSAKNHGDRVIIRIKDTGVGMEQQVLNNILEKKETLSTRGTGKEKGSGLGLLICKDMIDRHNGTLTGESRPGEGSEFKIELPGKQIK